MTLPLHAEMLAGCYDFLRSTPPFRSWNLPEPEEVQFVVSRHVDRHGWYRRVAGRHVIGVSRRYIGHTSSLVEVMAHEMVHLHQALAGMETSAQHNAAFQKLAARVCKFHGFDPKLF